MKNNFLYIIIGSFLSIAALAQDNTKSTSDAPKAKSFIGITGGYSNLLGNLAKFDYADDKSGYANKTGFNVGVEGAYFFHKNIGFGGIYSNTSFFTNGVQTLADGYKEDFAVDSTTVDVKGRYTLNNFLVGPYFSFPVKKFTFDVRVVAGISSIKTPQFTTYLEDQTDVTFSQNSSTAAAFAFQAGAGVRYSLIENLCVKLNFDFFNSNPNIKITNTNRVVKAGRLITEYKQPISVISINFGIAYQFGKK